MACAVAGAVAVAVIGVVGHVTEAIEHRSEVPAYRAY
jgi:hypothetical protein